MDIFVETDSAALAMYMYIPRRVGARDETQGRERKAEEKCPSVMRCGKRDLEKCVTPAHSDGLSCSKGKSHQRSSLYKPLAHNRQLRDVYEM